MNEGGFDRPRHVSRDQRRKEIQQRIATKKGVTQKPSIGIKGKAILAVAAGGTAIGTVAATHQESSSPIIHQAQAQTEQEEHADSIEIHKTTYTDLLTKELQHQQRARERIEQQKNIVRNIALDAHGHPSKSLQRIITYQEKIRDEAQKHNIPLPLAMAEALVEGEQEEQQFTGNEYGAVGMYGLLVPTAEKYGLITRDATGKIVKDDRFIPEKNIEAGLAHLQEQIDFAGTDTGLGTWMYYNGVGTLARLLHTMDASLPSQEDIVKDGRQMTRITKAIQERHISEQSLLDDPAVAALIENNGRGGQPTLPPFIRGYVPRVAAAAEFLIENGHVPPERIIIDVPSIPSQPTSRKDGAQI